MKRKVALLLACLFVLSGVELAAHAQSAPTAAAGADVDPEQYGRAAELIPVQRGRRLNLRCMGSGEPTVVLDAGATQDSMAWWKVQGRIAAFTRVCAYDRAGYGYSDPNTRASTAANFVDDLHRLLDGAHVPRPVVLVGHSAGGLYATLYADQYLSEVAGMVLVDPAFAGQLAQTIVLYKPGERAKLKPLQDANRAKLAKCASFARDRKLDALEQNKCSYIPPAFPRRLQDALRRQYAQSKYYEAELAENLALNGDIDRLPSEDDQAEYNAARSFGDMPLIVLTNSVGIRSPILSPETNAKASAVWKAGHDRLAARSSIGKSIVVPDTGHMIQIDQPAAVVSAIREVVDAIRSHANAHPRSSGPQGSDPGPG